MFPGVGAEVDYNEAGEPLGWGSPIPDDAYYCDMCGCNHSGDCWSGVDDDVCEDCGELENSVTSDCTCDDENDHMDSVVVEPDRNTHEAAQTEQKDFDKWLSAFRERYAESLEYLRRN